MSPAARSPYAALAALAAVVLAGCAAAPSRVAEDARELPPITAYAANPFVPVNLYLNANEHLDAGHAARVEHAARRLAGSKAFVRLDRGVQRWPITLQANYRVEDMARSWRARVLFEPIERVHTLVVEIVEEPESVATLELSTRSSGPDHAVVEDLLEQLMAEIAMRKLVPRWKEFEPERPRRKKPQGRAT